MTARKDGLSRTPSVLCGERMERQEAVLFVGVRMVGSCFISIPASASITEQKICRPLQETRPSSVGSGRQVSASGVSVRKRAPGPRGSAHAPRYRDSAVREEAEAL